MTTVVTELALKAFDSEGENQALAMNALQHLREWGIQPCDLKSVGHGITEEFARRLIQKRLLPDGEFNDGVILAETACGNTDPRDYRQTFAEHRRDGFEGHI